MDTIYYFVPRHFDTMGMKAFVISNHPDKIKYGFHPSDEIDEQLLQKGLSELLENYWEVPEHINRKNLVAFLDSLGFIFSDQLKSSTLED